MKLAMRWEGDQAVFTLPDFRIPGVFCAIWRGEVLRRGIEEHLDESLARIRQEVLDQLPSKFDL